MSDSQMFLGQMSVGQMAFDQEMMWHKRIDKHGVEFDEMEMD